MVRRYGSRVSRTGLRRVEELAGRDADELRSVRLRVFGLALNAEQSLLLVRLHDPKMLGFSELRLDKLARGVTKG